jgi:hypothetical protein
VDHEHGHPEPERRSWLPPIVIGALVTYAGSALLIWAMFAGLPGVGVVAQCACTLAFVPFGAIPAWLTFRRDPALTPGQGFAVAFIAVGLGSVLWAGARIASSEVPRLDTPAIREAIERSQEELPADERASAEQIDATIRFLEAVWPYVPAILALLLTVFGGLSGLVTAVILQARGANHARAGPP